MDAKVPSPTGLRHLLLAAGIGSALEWYDFFIYGLASALVFGPLFFPGYDPATGTLAAFATFAVGFLARPFGGLFFGHFGDRWGREPMLVATLLLVGRSTFLIGCLPTYAHAGIVMWPQWIRRPSLSFSDVYGLLKDKGY